MRLVKARVQNYRSVIDSGEFEIEKLKTIMVGPNEAGKTVLLRALQQLHRPTDVPGFDALRDYPRSLYNDISTGKINPKDITVVTGYFNLEESDKAQIPAEFHNCIYKLWTNLDNKKYHSLENAPANIYYKEIKKDIGKLAIHIDSQYSKSNGVEEGKKPSELLKEITTSLQDYSSLSGQTATKLKGWLDVHLAYIEDDNEVEDKRHENILTQVQFNSIRDKALDTLGKRVPVFILFNNYFHVKPSIHLEHLAKRVEENLLDDQYYDYGNLCLLKLLGFTPRELSDLGSPTNPGKNNPDGLKQYKDQLDKRTYQLNAASVRLTKEITSVWMPDKNRAEADKLKITADGQYLKVVVEDDIGVEIELDQRSEGFQWLVSFFVVFFSESQDKHANAILLLDEPGMSLHGLKQRDFRQTISRLAEKNQTIFTTHSPFLVGPDELDIVRVVEMKTRTEGTKVHTTISSSDPAGLLPLQEALGYDLAQSLFSQQRNLVLEGITDYWYIETTAELLRDGKVIDLNEKIALVFANSAGKVVYYATILHAHKLQVAALLDSDSAGDQAANQENLVHALGNKKILRTKDFCPTVKNPEIEDMLRDTLSPIITSTFGTDITSIATSQPMRPLIDICSTEIANFSKYKLAKAFIQWSRSHSASDLSHDERTNWTNIITKINTVLK